MYGQMSCAFEYKPVVPIIALDGAIAGGEQWSYYYTNSLREIYI
jgi:hypothetical protein